MQFSDHLPRDGDRWVRNSVVPSVSDGQLISHIQLGKIPTELKCCENLLNKFKFEFEPRVIRRA